MAEVSYLRLHDPDDGVPHGRRNHHHHHQQDEALNLLDSLPYWSHPNDFDLYSSDPEFPPTDASVPDSFLPTDGPDLLDRQNQVNFVMDLFHQRVEQSQVISQNNNDDCTDLGSESGFGVIEGNCETGMDNLELELGLGVEFGGQESNSCGFVVETIGDSDIDMHVDIYGNDDEDNDDDDDFFVERRVSGLESGEAASTMEAFASGIRIIGFGSDSDDEDENQNENERERLGINLHSGDEYGNDDGDDESVSIPLCWDSLQLEDHRETNEEFEWEEVDGLMDERDVLSMILDAGNQNSISGSHQPIIASEDVVSVERMGGLGNLEWQVLLNSDNLETSPDTDDNVDPYFGDHDDYIYTAEYEMLFGQFAENENAFLGRPPASRTVIENLASVVLTQEDVENNNALCAICKDEINTGEKAKQLPCTHRYHGDCIMTWLAIRNTCPVCRHELPTDDAEYERRRSRRDARDL